MSHVAREWAKKQPLKGPSKMVLMQLADAYNGDTHRCFPGIERLAAECGLGRSTVIRAIKKLVEIGLISTSKKHGCSTHYGLRFHAVKVDEPVSERHQCQSDTSVRAALDQSQSDTKPVSERHPNSKEQERTVIKPIVKYSPEDFEIAKMMWEKIQPITKQNRAPAMDKWAETIRLLREQDGRDHILISRVFNWANQDEFWRSNILSPAKLRKQFDQLFVKMEQPHEIRLGRDTGSAGQGSTRSTSIAEDLKDKSWAY